jgi:DEAD/DEAH box helicase domain-containing protein
MLHAAILPNHTRWIGFFQGLRWIVIDELHQYRGVFGAHVGNVLRRLKRICRFYGADPRFVCTSATIGNPGELAELLLGEPVTVIDRSGAPQGAREIWLCNPPLANATTGSRSNPLGLAIDLAAEAMQLGNPTILFCRGRMEVEVALTLLRERVPGVESYRGGYLPSERRSIERRLRDGELPGVVSTNALELGIDIGSLDVAISCGYPGSLASARQQMGRAGRRQETALSVMVAGTRPLDQYLVRHPEYFFERTAEHAITDPNNDLIRATQLRCAAFELPFEESEEFGGPDTREFLDFFAEESILHAAGGRYHWMAESFPAREVSLRSAADENVVIIERVGPNSPGARRPLPGASGVGQERVIGEMDRSSAVTMLHEQAIYVHRGQQYHVDRFDYAERKAWVTKVDVEYYTQAELSVDIKVLEADRSTEQGEAGAALGDVTLAIIPTIFKKLKIHGAENVGAGPINLPEERFQTTALWFAWGNDQTPIRERLTPFELEEGLGGLTHLVRELAPLFAMCDRGDIGGAAKIRAPETGVPTVYFYDQYPGGIGLAERLFAAREGLLRTARETLERCACADGCPGCVGPSNNPATRRKPSTAVLLQSLLASAAE